MHTDAPHQPEPELLSRILPQGEFVFRKVFFKKQCKSFSSEHHWDVLDVGAGPLPSLPPLQLGISFFPSLPAPLSEDSRRENVSGIFIFILFSLLPYM